ncbi:MAG: transporter substrate-binding domain-containing protein [Acidimicrobiales bacterium]|jgi:polar amino acid transport system substrate-binding protein|nr:transporter substrate-binding domain-containing protein [Acidimicrobiales bacterium]
MHLRTTRLLAVVAAGTLLFGACSDDSDDETTDAGDATSTTAAGGADLSGLLAEVDLVADGKLTVCSDFPYAPFEYEDTDSGELTGFDVELVGAMAGLLGVESEFKDTDFDGILTQMAAGNCDMVASAVTITEERAQSVDFTEPYFDADQSLLIRAEDEGTYASLEDLAGKTIGVQTGTTGEEYANDNTPEGATIKSFGGADEMFLALTSGDVDALLQDFPVNAYQAVQDDSFVVTETFPTGEQYGMAVEKGDSALLEALDAALAETRSNGTYEEIYTSYFGEAPTE